jgi:hypothetical protein
MELPMTRVEELTKTSLELWMRAEWYRTTLTRIQKLNPSPEINHLIRQVLEERK